jgi:hypothetical protein
MLLAACSDQTSADNPSSSTRPSGLPSSSDTAKSPVTPVPFRSTVSPRTVPVLHGTVVLHGLYVSASNGLGTTCEATGNMPPNKAGLKPIPSSYDDVKLGAAVRLADPSGHTLGTAKLGAGRAEKMAHPVDEYDLECDFPFTMQRVTIGSRALTVTVGHHHATVSADRVPTLRVPVGQV